MLVGMNVLSAAQPHPLSRTDQPVALFKFDGGKYPALTVFHPSVNKCNVVLCGTYDMAEDTYRTIKTPADLENLAALREMMRSLDTFTQYDKKIKGRYREAPAAVALETVFDGLFLMSDDSYNGILLVDEYRGGYNQKWVLRPQDVKPVLNYLRKKFDQEGVMSLAKKPPLLIVGFDGVDIKLDDADEAFVGAYFTPLKSEDPVVFGYFQKVDERIIDTFDKTGKADFVGESAGETILREIEGQTGKLDTKRMILMFGAFVVGSIIINKMINGAIQDKVTSLLSPKKDKSAPAVPQVVMTDAQLEKLVDRIAQKRAAAAA